MSPSTVSGPFTMHMSIPPALAEAPTTDPRFAEVGESAKELWLFQVAKEGATHDTSMPLNVGIISLDAAMVEQPTTTVLRFIEVSGYAIFPEAPPS